MQELSSNHLFSPVGNTVEDFFRQHRIGIRVASGYVGARIAVAAGRWGLVKGKWLFGYDPKGGRVTPELRDGLAALARDHEVRLLHGLHAKMLIGTDSVLLGSMNISKSGLELLDEVAVQVADSLSVERAVQIFEEWWSRATPFGEAVLKIERKAAKNADNSGTSLARKHRSAFSRESRSCRTEIEEFLESILPDALERRLVLTVVAKALGAFERPGKESHWAVTFPEGKRIVRVNVGRVEALSLCESELKVHLAGLTSSEKKSVDRMGGARVGGHIDARKMEPTAEWVTVPLGVVDELSEALVVPFGRFIAGRTWKTNYAAKHRDDILETIEMVSKMKLPRPKSDTPH